MTDVDKHASLLYFFTDAIRFTIQTLGHSGMTDCSRTFWHFCKHNANNELLSDETSSRRNDAAPKSLRRTVSNVLEDATAASETSSAVSTRFLQPRRGLFLLGPPMPKATDDGLWPRLQNIFFVVADLARQTGYQPSLMFVGWTCGRIHNTSFSLYFMNGPNKQGPCSRQLIFFVTYEWSQ